MEKVKLILLVHCQTRVHGLELKFYLRKIVSFGLV